MCHFLNKMIIIVLFCLNQAIYTLKWTMYMEIKDFIKERRKQLKMSLQTLGDAISYTPQAIARFENGKVKFDIGLIDDLIKVLNVSLSTF